MRSDVSHNFSFSEVIIFLLVVLVLIFVVTPKFFNVLSKIKMDSAVSSVDSYKSSIDNYYVSKLLYDSNFKLDGVYTIVDGVLTDDNESYNISYVGAVPTSGYLNYSNNVLKDGCLVVNNYSVTFDSSEIISVSKGSCDNLSREVAYN